MGGGAGIYFFAEERRGILRSVVYSQLLYHMIMVRVISLLQYTSLFFFKHIYFPAIIASAQAVVTGVVPSSPRFLPSIFIAHMVQRSHCSSIFHRVYTTLPALPHGVPQHTRNVAYQKLRGKLNPTAVIY